MPDVFGSHTSSGPGVTEIFLNPMLPSRRTSVPAGTVFFEPGDAAPMVYFIHRGQVRTYQVGPDGESRLMEILGVNEWFGASAVPKRRA